MSALLFALVLVSAQTQMYRWVDKGGEAHFTNDRASIPKGAKVQPYELGESGIAIDAEKKAPEEGASPPPPPGRKAPSTPGPRRALKEESPRLLLGALPKNSRPGDEETFAAGVETAASSAKLKAFGGLLQSIHIDFIEDARDPRLTLVPEWAAGFALSATQVYLLSPYVGPIRLSQPTLWARMTVHEVAHAQQMQLTQAKLTPRWFSEGYAMYVAGDDPGASLEDVAWWAIARGGGAALSNAFAAGPTRPTLRGGERADHAMMDYRLSLEGVKLMVARRGERAVAALLRLMHDEPAGFSEAFAKAMGLELKDFEMLLIEELKPHYHQRAE